MTTDEIMFTASKGELAAGLTWAAHGISRRPVVPVLGGMRLQASQGRITLTGFDYEITARCHVPAEVTAAGTVLPAGSELVKAVKGLPGKRDAQVTVMTEDGRLSLECEGVFASVELLDLSDYPAAPVMPAEAAVIAGDVFAGAVARVAPCACTDDTLPIITCVRVEFGAVSGVTLAATDRYRLAVEDVPATFTCDGIGERSVSIPAPALAAFAKVADRAGKVTVHMPVSEDEPRAGFSDGTRELITRVNSGDFVRYRSLLPGAGDLEVSATVEAKALSAAVKRAGAAAERNTAVKLQFTGERVNVTSERDGKVASSAALRASVSGAGGFEVLFNPAYLRSLLDAAGGQAQIWYRAQVKPVLVTSADSPAWRGLIVPIRPAGA